MTCAFEHSLELKTILDEGDEVKFKSYCLKHSKGKAGEAALSPARSKPPAEAEKVGLRAQRLQELEEDFYTLVQLGEVSRELGLSERPADFIYQYWKLKRKTNFNKALLPPKEGEENVVLQPQEDSIHTRMRMFMHLRQDLERVSSVTIVLLAVVAEAVTASFLKILQLANQVILAEMIVKTSVNSMLNKLRNKPNACRSKLLADTSLLLRGILKTPQKSLKLHNWRISLNINVFRGCGIRARRQPSYLPKADGMLGHF